MLATGLGVPVQVEADPAGLAATMPVHDRGADAALRVSHALADLARSGIAVSDFALAQPSLDEVFLVLTGSRTEPERLAEEAVG